jgi:3-isopropylmalate dehydrogenase
MRYFLGVWVVQNGELIGVCFFLISLSGDAESFQKRGTAYPNPESGLLRLRQHLDAFANIRPCTFYSQSLIPLSPLKQSVAEGTNFIILRENCGGAYFGEKVEEADYASDSWAYKREEIERASRVAAALAEKMGKDGLGTGKCPQGPATVWSSDKANVLASGRLWRKVTSEVFAKEFPHIELKHQLADSLSMLMCKNPRMFNGVIHTDNTFGDMLSDQAGGVVGTLGVLPSASLCGVPDGSKCNGIYEPTHGSAPDISGKGIVNPTAQILSAAMMLRYSFNMGEEALAIEQAVEKVLDGKDIGGLEIRTGDLGGKATTKEVGDAIVDILRQVLSGHLSSVGPADPSRKELASRAKEHAAHGDENKKWENKLRKEHVNTGPSDALIQP